MKTPSEEESWIARRYGKKAAKRYAVVLLSTYLAILVGSCLAICRFAEPRIGLMSVLFSLVGIGLVVKMLRESL
jgi:hypothetical protein